jgi:hypothetical protein
MSTFVKEGDKGESWNQKREDYIVLSLFIFAILGCYTKKLEEYVCEVFIVEKAKCNKVFFSCMCF